MKKKLTFEQAMGRLEEIVELLSRGQLTLDESLELYKEGADLAALCDKQLAEAKLKIETLYPGEKPEGETTTDA